MLVEPLTPSHGQAHPYHGFALLYLTFQQEISSWNTKQPWNCIPAQRSVLGTPNGHSRAPGCQILPACGSNLSPTEAGTGNKEVNPGNP